MSLSCDNPQNLRRESGNSLKLIISDFVHIALRLAFVFSYVYVLARRH
jgi:hypothetical protein